MEYLKTVGFGFGVIFWPRFSSFWHYCANLVILAHRNGRDQPRFHVSIVTGRNECSTLPNLAFNTFKMSRRQTLYVCKGSVTCIARALLLDVKSIFIRKRNQNGPVKGDNVYHWPTCGYDKLQHCFFHHHGHKYA